MEQDHAAFFIDVEKYPSNSILGQASFSLHNAVSQRSANGHPDRPAELYRFNVFRHPLPVLIQRNSSGQVRSGSSASIRPKKTRLDSLTLFSAPQIELLY